MYLGIEIGGTKLQIGVGDGATSQLVALVRKDVDAAAGAQPILANIRDAVRTLAATHPIKRIGIGFGGPVAADRAHVVTSHQVDGWTGFPLVAWCCSELGLPTVLGNDADLAGLAEARYGAGRDYNPMFYITVGTGLGGGFIINRRLYEAGGHGASEIGHLRPGVDAVTPHDTVESRAAGPGIAAAAREALQRAGHAEARELLTRCGGAPERITAKVVAEAAAVGDPVARAVLDRAARALGWGIAQMITLLAPATVVIGGGVALAGEELFFVPLRRYVDLYAFPPFRGTCAILPAQLGEEMVVYGALALAAEHSALS